jgi:hypothetical protein
VDLAGLWVHDAGAGLLAALGAGGDRPARSRCRRASRA